MRLLSSSHKSRNCHPFKSKAWKIIFHVLESSLHSFFLLKSHDDLHGKWGIRLNDLVSLSTTLWSNQLHQLGHSQNSIKFSWWVAKNFWSSWRIDKAWIWKECDNGSNIFFAVWIKLVTTMIFDIPVELVAWFILHLIVKSLASVLLMFTTWWRVLMTGLLQMWTWAIDVATLFLILVLVMTSVWEGFSDEVIAKLSN